MQQAIPDIQEGLPRDPLGITLLYLDASPLAHRTIQPLVQTQSRYPFSQRCNVSLKSSHLGCLLRAILNGASVAKGTVWPPVVVPLDPVPDDAPRLLEGLEPLLTDTLFLETAKNRSMMPFCSGVCGVMNSCSNRYSRQACRNRQLWKIRPLSLRKIGARRAAGSRTAAGTRLRRPVPPPSPDRATRTRSP